MYYILLVIYIEAFECENSFVCVCRQLTISCVLQQTHDYHYQYDGFDRINNNTRTCIRRALTAHVHVHVFLVPISLAAIDDPRITDRLGAIKLILDSTYVSIFIFFSFNWNP